LNDYHFFLAFLERMRLDDIQIQVYGGKPKLPDFLRTLPALPNFGTVSSIGIVRDADSNPQQAFASIQDALRRAGLPFPEQPEVPQGNGRSVTVLLLPDAESTGELETLLLRAVVDDPAIPCVDHYFECIQAKANPPAEVSMDKARLHAFLASKPEPGLPTGTAARASYLKLDSHVYNHVRRFIETLSSTQ
jgi:hypothetical protein